MSGLLNFVTKAIHNNPQILWLTIGFFTIVVVLPLVRAIRVAVMIIRWSIRRIAVIGCGDTLLLFKHLGNICIKRKE